MLAIKAGLGMAALPASRHAPPAGLGGGAILSALTPMLSRGCVTTGIDPRSLVDSAMWTGPVFHVDGSARDDTNSGLCAVAGDFSNALRTIYRAFELGNATNAAYRIAVQPGAYEEAAFSKNGQREPSQPVAILGWGGPVRYRTRRHSVTWSEAGGTFSTAVSSVRRVFRSDETSAAGVDRELIEVADAALCAATVDSWCDFSGMVHVNIGRVPGPSDIVQLRSFHGARFLTHAHDL